MPYHGNSTIQYFEGSRFIGERLSYCCGAREADGISFSAFWPHTAYFCPYCGEVWGREIYQHHFEYSPRPPESWVVEKRPCPRHGDGQFLSGLSEFEHCSDDLLRREVLVLLLKEQS